MRLPFFFFLVSMSSILGATGSARTVDYEAKIKAQRVLKNNLWLDLSRRDYERVKETSTYRLIQLTANEDLDAPIIRNEIIELASRIPSDESNDLFPYPIKPWFSDQAKQLALYWFITPKDPTITGRFQFDGELQLQLVAAYLRGSDVELMLEHRGRYDSAIHYFITEIQRREAPSEFLATVENLMQKLQVIHSIVPKRQIVYLGGTGAGAVMYPKARVERWLTELAVSYPQCASLVVQASKVAGLMMAALSFWQGEVKSE